MNRNMKRYTVIWAVFLAMFNAVCFLIPRFTDAGLVTLDKFGGAFWVGYCFITLAFLGQLFCACYALREEKAGKLFYKIPLIRISYTDLILMLIAGSLVMAVPDLPKWLGALVCILILGFSVIALLKADAAAELAAEVDDRVKAKTQFVRLLTVEAEGLVSRAKTPEAKAACRKVYEAIRYSDPMSSEALSTEEAKITVKMDALSKAVEGGENAEIAEEAEALVLLVDERNRKCRMLK